MLTDKQKGLADVLEQLAGSPGILGAMLVSRDGFALLSRCSILPMPDTFSAMSATLVGAAEAALLEAGVTAPARAIIEAGDRRIIAVGATGEILLVAVTDHAESVADALGRVERASQEVARVLGAR